MLAYPKFKLAAHEQQELVADYLPWAEVATVPESPSAVPERRDMHELPFLHLAVAGQADVLVTGDADLLVLAIPAHQATANSAVNQPRLGCRVLTMQAFLDSLGT